MIVKKSLSTLFFMSTLITMTAFAQKAPEDNQVPQANNPSRYNESSEAQAFVAGLVTYAAAFPLAWKVSVPAFAVYALTKGILKAEDELTNEGLLSILFKTKKAKVADYINSAANTAFNETTSLPGNLFPSLLGDLPKNPLVYGAYFSGGVILPAVVKFLISKGQKPAGN